MGVPPVIIQSFSMGIFSYKSTIPRSLGVPPIFRAGNPRSTLNAASGEGAARMVSVRDGSWSHRTHAETYRRIDGSPIGHCYFKIKKPLNLMIMAFQSQIHDRFENEDFRSQAWTKCSLNRCYHVSRSCTCTCAATDLCCNAATCTKRSSNNGPPQVLSH